MVEEREREHDPALLVDRDVTPVADPVHEVQEPRLELLEAAPLAGIAARGLRVGAFLSGRRRHVRRLAAVLDPVAVGRERIVALAVVLLHAGEILVRGRDQVRARHPLFGRYRLQVERIRRAERLDALARVLVANHDLLDLRDLLVANLQAQRDQRRRALARLAVVFLDRAEERDLPGRHVGHEQPVVSLRAQRVPEPVADREPLAVLGEAHAGRERHGAGVVRNHGVEVTVDEALEARAVAVRGVSETAETGERDGREPGETGSDDSHCSHPR